MNGFNMLPDGGHVNNVADIDSMLWEASSKLARSQIARQISSNSVLNRQHASRIQKPASTGNSPNNISRQRMMASRQRLAPRHSDLYPQVYRRRAITAATNDPTAETRPLTWHPQVMPNPEAQIQRHTMYDASHQHMSAQPGNVSSGSSPSFHLDPQAGHRNRYYSVPAQNYLGSSYMHVPISSDWSTEPTQAPPSAVSSAATLPTMEHSSVYGHNGFTPQSFVPLTPSNYMPPQPFFHTTPANALTQSTQQNVDAFIQQQTPEVAVEDDGPELIGMGLYDKPEAQSKLCGGFGEFVPRASGRGLKLEDSWTPPEDDDESDDGSGDEEDEEDQKDDESTGEPDESSLPKVYGSNNLLPQFDMGNKAFFLDGTPDAAMGAAALRNLTMADWNVSPQSWTT